jgi:xanthosine utilization system XapX-like protein
LGKESKFHRGIDYLSFNLNLLIKLSTLPRFDIVIGLTSPPLISFFGVLFCLLKGGKFIHWAMDINPDEAIALGWIKKGSTTHKIMNWLSLFTYKKSSQIVVLDDFMAKRIERKGINKEKIVVIPPWPHDSDITYVPQQKNPFRKKYSLNHEFVVMYSGNHSVCHPLNTLLTAARILKRRKEIIFMFIGGGVRVKDVLAYKKKYNLSNIIYLPYQKRSDLKYSLSTADLHTVVMGERFVGIVHPCKIYGILKVGSPFVLIGPSKSHIGDILMKMKIGYHVANGDSEKLVSIIHKVMQLKNYEKYNIRRRSQELVRKKFSKKILCSKLIKTCNGHKTIYDRR